MPVTETPVSTRFPAVVIPAPDALAPVSFPPVTVRLLMATLKPLPIENTAVLAPVCWIVVVAAPPPVSVRLCETVKIRLSV